MLLVIDNFDSFTYNLVQYFAQLGVEQRVFRNNEISVKEALDLKPERVMISPGPCSPNEAGVSLDIIDAFAGKVPLLGVCLGHHTQRLCIVLRQRSRRGLRSLRLQRAFEPAVSRPFLSQSSAISRRFSLFFTVLPGSQKKEEKRV